MITDDDKVRRCGNITASRMKDLLAVSKRDGKPLQAREDYMAEVALERLTGHSIGIPMNVAMQWGVDTEAFARAAYEAHSGTLVSDAPFKLVADMPYVGASPDGLIATDGGLEIKCPYNSLIHMKTWLHGMPDDHMAQIQCGLWVYARQWWDFVSYDPRMPENLRLYVKRVQHDDIYIAKMKSECEKFNTEVETFVSALLEASMPTDAFMDANKSAPLL